MFTAECETVLVLFFSLAMEKSVSDWSVDDVKKYLEEHDLTEYAQGFLGKYFFIDIFTSQ